MKLGDIYRQIWHQNREKEKEYITIEQIHALIHTASYMGLSELTFRYVPSEVEKQLEDEGFRVDCDGYETCVEWYYYEEE